MSQIEKYCPRPAHVRASTVTTVPARSQPLSRRELNGLIQEARAELRTCDAPLKRYWQRRLQAFVLQAQDNRRFGGVAAPLRNANAKAFGGFAKKSGTKTGAFIDF